MDRRSKLVGHITAQTKLVEIGALCRPLISKTEAQVFYVDYADSNFLKQRYRNDINVDTQAIVEVDGVWGGENLKTVVGNFGPVDVVIASHVAEHVPDLISWLDEISEILKPGGFVALAIPNMQATFDKFRRLSTLTDLLENFLFRRRIPSALQVLDHVINVDLGFLRVPNAQNEACIPSQLTQEDLSGLRALVTDIDSNGTYHDVHCNTFTASSFAALMLDVASLELIDLACSAMFDPDPDRGEFIVRLEKGLDRAEVISSWQLARDAANRMQVEKNDEAGPSLQEDSSCQSKRSVEQAHVSMKADSDEHYRKGYLQGQQEAQLELIHAQRQIHALLNSRSWRLTQPYRWVGKLFKRHP